MNKLCKKIEEDLNEKVVPCLKGENPQNVIKTFETSYSSVRPIKKQKQSKKIYHNEDSIYKEVIAEFLKLHPNLIKETEEI